MVIQNMCITITQQLMIAFTLYMCTERPSVSV